MKTIQSWVADLKGRIDSSSSNQQMTMFSLQSCNSARSLAFEAVSNVNKKDSDTKSTLVGNMR